MLVHLLATLAVAGVACLTLWAVGRHLGRPMPGYVMPMVGALVAIGYGVYAEYSWSGRTEEALPESFVVLQRIEVRSTLSPWSWLVPSVVRLSAIDTAAVRRHPAHPELRLLDVLLFERFHPVRRVAQLVDCAALRRADLASDEAFPEEGLPAEPRWRDVGTGDRVVDAACDSVSRASPVSGSPAPERRLLAQCLLYHHSIASFSDVLDPAYRALPRCLRAAAGLSRKEACPGTRPDPPDRQGTVMSIPS